MPREKAGEPRTFFLNERHELAHTERAGGGGMPKLAPINWKAKGARLHASLVAARDELDGSDDPVRESRYFLLATPSPHVAKLSSNQKRAPTGTFNEATDYAGEHSRVFRRLGLDLLGVTDDGLATVHATPDRIAQLVSTTEVLPTEGPKSQARWATIESFGTIPAALRVDSDWRSTLDRNTASEALIEFQPLITRVEADDLVRAISRLIDRRHDEQISNVGSDFSGRYWIRARLTPRTIDAVGRSFYSVQLVHAPMSTLVSADASGRKNKRSAANPVRPGAAPPDLSRAPCVAVLDTGVPADHAALAPFRRGQYRSPQSGAPHLGDHGSFVASRIVYGDVDFADGPTVLPPPTCLYLDAMIAISDKEIDDKAVLSALEAIVGTSPDVRVFNLSFSDRAHLGVYSEAVRRQKLLLVQDLDNFIFSRDVLVVVAAGNVEAGIVPSSPYPDHYDDPRWGLGSWPSGYNTLTCGALVARPVPDGVAGTAGFPSPFTRLGPGVSQAPTPDFAANGGDGASDYHHRPLLGVWGCTAGADWEDRSGTSFAAPLLAREAAFALSELQKSCASGTRPFAATVKAFLALTAVRPPTPKRVERLADLASGYGVASCERLRVAGANSAVCVWQAVLDGPGDIARVKIPLPREWLSGAAIPRLRVVCCWDSPVHEAVREIWACRRVSIQLRPSDGSAAYVGSQRAHHSYPIADHVFDLSSEKLESRKVVLTDDVWLLEVSYSQEAEYYPGQTFAPQQRVGVAIELRDDGEKPVSPQSAVAALPMAATMTRLSTLASPIPTLVAIRAR